MILLRHRTLRISSRHHRAASDAESVLLSRDIKTMGDLLW